MISPLMRNLIIFTACILAFVLGSEIARYQGSTFWLKGNMESFNG